jgi:histidyl-tRNA synthetase
MKLEKVSQPKGTRDFGPKVMAQRNWILTIIKQKFQKFGFDELQTPALENLSVLLGKYGEEGDKLVFKILNSGRYLKKGEAGEVTKEILDQGETKLTPLISEKGLRYDLTVPFARFIAKNHREISFPFKRFQIQPVWRADRPQKGRFREFFQCDADTVGSYSPYADAEMIVLAHEIMEALGISEFSFHLNHRKILNGICSEFCPEVAQERVLACLDKKEKIGNEKVLGLLKELEVSDRGLDGFKKLLEMEAGGISIIEKIEELANGSQLAKLGLSETREIFKSVQDLDLPNFSLKFTPSLARGLDYYTGSIFEIVVPGSEVGSLCGGGRYDDLTGIFGVEGIPGVGISFGLDRIFELLKSKGSFPDAMSEDSRFLVCHVDENCMPESWKLLGELRKADCQGSIFPETGKLKKQIQYADKNGFRYIIVVGPEEIKNQLYKIKDLRTGEQESISMKKIIQTLMRID